MVGQELFWWLSLLFQRRVNKYDVKKKQLVEFHLSLNFPKCTFLGNLLNDQATLFHWQKSLNISHSTLVWLIDLVDLIGPVMGEK